MSSNERSEEEQRGFYTAVVDRALEAQAQAGATTRLIELAGIRIRLVFAGQRLLDEFMGALAHLELVDWVGATDATFHLWDTESTGVAMLPPPLPSESFTDRGDLWGFSSFRYRSAFHWSEYSVCVFDSETQIGAYWVNRTSNLPYWARSSPMRTLFHWLMERHGRQLLHAAAIGTDAGGVLIVGKGGVGKSTTSLSSLVRGLRFAGDDYVVVGFDPEPTVWSLYCTAKVTPQQLAAFPDLEPLADPIGPGDEKAVIRLYPDHAERFARSLPLRWLVTPRFGEGPETRFEPISQVALHQAAAFTTLLQLPHAGATTHAFVARLIDALPGAQMTLGSDVSAVPGAIVRLIEEGADVEQARHAARPLVTVIVPVFNGAHFLESAIASIVAQRYPALEIIIVDDGSTDEIEAAVAASPVDVRFFRQMNAGPAAARNRGLRDASGDLIAFLDVDDLWPEGTIEALFEIMEATPEADVVIGRAQMARIIDDCEDSFYDESGGAYPYYIGSALYRRRVFDRIGLFDDGLRFAEDTDWFQRLKERGGDLRRIERTTLVVRRHGGNMTEGKTRVELGMIQALKRALDRRRAQAES
ncbi:glycosyltransferase [Sphingomonas paeninsulae]|uniref:Glycosyltransferase n=1 Tax=Sphingomonas paeninsulae TaxID=2319844 RepID=A0A494TL75_SPHPE|nr:glycosyltransferase [Sphingomonas paeninsulae]AYJ85865.1 glycosyltransferase [Sphingomonas paeninsulae]